MAITKALADSYFATNNHSDAPIWRAYGSQAREAAIAEAQRFLASIRMAPAYTASGTSPSAQTDRLDTDTTTDTQFPREDLATYEQALWFLMFGDATHNGEQTGAKWITERIGQMRAEGATKYQLAPMARHWMGWSYRRRMAVRG